MDSCIDQQSRQIPVLNYLQGLGVNLAEDVKLVVGTHAHDDHIAGLAQVFEACESAKFVCSSALTGEEFFGLIEADRDIEDQLRQSIRREYRAIFAAVTRRPPGPHVKRAVEELPLLARPASQTAPAATVTALSPSHHAVTRATGKLAAGLAKADDRRKLGSADPNELAVALSLVVGDTAVVLGADLLAGPGGCGWQAVLATFRPEALASLFKVPHHGAPNAHHDDIWTQLLSAGVVSVLAPFRAGKTPRPQPEDIERLKSRSIAVYSSANPNRPTPGKAVKSARAALAGIATNVRSTGVSGHVQARKACGAANWNVETFWPALRL